jgi:hypothetical protein
MVGLTDSRLGHHLHGCAVAAQFHVRLPNLPDALQVSCGPDAFNQCWYPLPYEPRARSLQSSFALALANGSLFLALPYPVTEALQSFGTGPGLPTALLNTRGEMIRVNIAVKTIRFMVLTSSLLGFCCFARP